MIPISTEVGRLLTASHASMRDDFQITTAQLDLIADTAVQAGASGARMTGGGFGGCVIALVLAEHIAAVGDAVRRTVSRAGYPAPTITTPTPGREVCGADLSLVGCRHVDSPGGDRSVDANSWGRRCTSHERLGSTHRPICKRHTSVAA